MNDSGVGGGGLIGASARCLLSGQVALLCRDALPCAFEPRPRMMQLSPCIPAFGTCAGFSKTEPHVSVQKSRSGFLPNLTCQAVVAFGKRTTQFRNARWLALGGGRGPG